MKNNDIEVFEKQWEQFMTRIQGRIMHYAQTQELSYSLMKLILKDVSNSWDSDLDGNGRWLKQYCRQNPQKGELIRRILLEDMGFTEVSKDKDNWGMLVHAVPVAGAAAGFGLSSVLGAGPVIKTVSTIAPALLLYPAARGFGGSVKDRRTEEYIDKYLLQLDKYKKSVTSILCP